VGILGFLRGGRERQKLLFINMGQKWDWTQNGLFFLTQTPVVEIITVGGGHDDVDFFHDGCLYLFCDQCVITDIEKEGVDRWGRNVIDRMFLAICEKLWVLTMVNDIAFHSLITRKDGDKHLVRVRYDDVDLELGVEEMYRHCINLIKKQDTNSDNE